MVTKDLKTAVEDTEKAMIHQALTEEAGNVAAAARALGVHFTSLWRKIKKYRIDLDRYQPFNTHVFYSLMERMEKWVKAGGELKDFELYSERYILPSSGRDSFVLPPSLKASENFGLPPEPEPPTFTTVPLKILPPDRSEESGGASQEARPKKKRSRPKR